MGVYALMQSVALVWDWGTLDWHTVPAHGFVVHFMASDIREKVYLEREFGWITIGIRDNDKGRLR